MALSLLLLAILPSAAFNLPQFPHARFNGRVSALRQHGMAAQRGCSSMSASKAEAELAKAQATLQGLVADGYGADVLGPLETKIAKLRSRVAGELLLPPAW